MWMDRDDNLFVGIWMTGEPTQTLFRTGARRLAVLLAASFLWGCGDDPAGVEPGEQARLSARPGRAPAPLPPGQYQLEIGADRDGWFYIPPGAQAGQDMPLVVLLHGAGGNGRNWDGAIKYADSLGMVLMAPDSRGATWDIVRGTFGPDVQFIDEALREVFHHANVDPALVALSGFSDGASYALSLGLSNGDLFTNVIAWSPGFMLLEVPRGRPTIYVSHGTLDPILSFDYTSQVLVPQLRGAGFEVVFEEFDGTHEITMEVAQNAFDWFLARP